MIEFVLPGLLLLFLAFIATASWYLHHKKLLVWTDLASRTGLKLYTEGRWWSTTRLCLHGSLNGVEVLVKTEEPVSGTSSHTLTVIIAELGPYIPRHMEIYHQGVISSVAKRLGTQDIEIGNPDVDKRFIIRSTPESLARDFFEVPSVQRALVSLHEFCPSFRLDDTTLRIELLAAEIDEERIFAHLMHLSRTAQTIREAYPAPVVSPVVESVSSGIW